MEKTRRNTFYVGFNVYMGQFVKLVDKKQTNEDLERFSNMLNRAVTFVHEWEIWQKVFRVEIFNWRWFLKIQQQYLRGRVEMVIISHNNTLWVDLRSSWCEF